MFEASAEFLALFLPNDHTEGEDKPDPHADYRVNPYSYLAIDGVTGEYSISAKPKEIPKGFHITQHEKVPGLRKFKVSKDGSHTYDIVYVGTMMVQNNFAYISGETLALEGPYDFLTFVWFPPFAISYPHEHPAGKTKEEFHAKILEDHKQKLIKSITENDTYNDITKNGIFDFDLTRELVLHPPLPLKCYTCQRELQIYDDSSCCDVCDFEGYDEVKNLESEPYQRLAELEGELRQSRRDFEELGSKFQDKYVLVAELKAEIKKMESCLKEKETELQAARAAERKALMKAARVTERIQAVQDELQELKVLIGSVVTDPDDTVLKKKRMSERTDAKLL